MKSIDEIKKLSAEELEAISEKAGIEVPCNLQDKLMENLSSEISGDFKKAHTTRKAMIISLVPAAAVLTLLFCLWSEREPEDTFRDPERAYAEVEKTFRFVSAQMNNAMEIVGNAEKTLDTSYDRMNSIIIK